MECYICLGGNEEKLIRPCPCKLVHRRCLNDWRAQNQNALLRCEVCHTVYNTKRLLIGSFLASKITIFIVSGILIAGSVYITGHTSSWITNIFYYWFHHLPYHSVNRLQTLVHGMFWTGLPGFLLVFWELITAGVLNNLNLNVNNRPHISINVPQQNTVPNPMTDDEIKEERKKGTKVAKYEGPSVGVWIFLISSIVLSYWKVWTKFGEWARKKASEYQDIVEYAVV